MTPEQQKKQNLRLALILATIVAAFFIGFIVRMVYFGG
ncbi:cytochrome oxidase small assembly protein [Caldimonas brevitalea]|uniref:Uncharacterized protein n=1 Tax=Caldimonas brevitalea TaxID=413882 RepID=A0A0G3BEH1_9BURK|nr:cytochrome oxidase small assembly protein [Caldimonas brevitalea]AKJ27789.1 hypothetical protein AAW51_1098 [Caldimonas brevitalea]